MNECKLIEDLYPLYEEQLVQPETAAYIKQHIINCSTCSNKFNNAASSITAPVQPSKVAAAVAVKKTESKLTIIQLLIMMLSFYFAMTTNILAESFGFILTYYILGVVTFLFYRSFFLTVVIAFLPIFVLAFYDTAFANNAFRHYKSVEDGGYVQFIFTHLVGASFMAMIHTAFAIIGAGVGELIMRLKKEVKG